MKKVEMMGVPRKPIEWLENMDWMGGSGELLNRHIEGLVWPYMISIQRGEEFVRDPPFHGTHGIIIFLWKMCIPDYFDANFKFVRFVILHVRKCLLLSL